MSIWTHIVATLDVDTHLYSTDIKHHVEAMLLNAPRITGSEGNAEVFVNLLSGHNAFVYSDCENCQYGSTRKMSEDLELICDADNDYECPDNEYQTRVLISIVGDLRDKAKSKTKQEFNEFVQYIIKTLGYTIRNKSVSIQ
jgi:hypothetical protein